MFEMMMNGSVVEAGKLAVQIVSEQTQRILTVQGNGFSHECPFVGRRGPGPRRLRVAKALSAATRELARVVIVRYRSAGSTCRRSPDTRNLARPRVRRLRETVRAMLRSHARDRVGAADRERLAPGCSTKAGMAGVVSRIVRRLARRTPPQKTPTIGPSSRTGAPRCSCS